MKIAAFEEAVNPDTVGGRIPVATGRGGRGKLLPDHYWGEMARFIGVAGNDCSKLTVYVTDEMRWPGLMEAGGKDRRKLTVYATDGASPSDVVLIVEARQ